jgi:hypothetical protein
MDPDTRKERPMSRRVTAAVADPPSPANRSAVNRSAANTRTTNFGAAPGIGTGPEITADTEPTLEEFLRPLRDRYRFLEDYFNLQAEASFADCPAEMSTHGLFGLNEICREGGDVLDDLIDRLPRSVINARVPDVRAPGPGRTTRGGARRG